MKRPQNGVQWQTNRCKRVVRPLLAKVHALTQTYRKTPEILETRFQNESISDEAHTKYTVNLSRLTKPANAHERLESLIPFITPDLHGFFVDIFHIFQNIIVTIEMSRPAQPIAKLGTRCCFEIGKAMVLSSRTTYYKLNQNILFDEDTLPEHIKKYHKNLSGDIDEWLDLEPASLFDDYKLDLLMGYILHLIVFNSSRLLYMLVPTLVHWLVEQSVISGNPNLRHFATKLWSEFWHFDNDKYYDNVSAAVVLELTGVEGKSNKEFWSLYHIGFWDKFISSIGFGSTGANGLETDHFEYETRLLDTLPLNEKLLDCGPIVGIDIYPILNRCYNHSQINNIMINILTNLVLEYKANFKDTNKVQAVYGDLLDLVSNWVSFGFESPGLFNSLTNGNDDLFNGILRLLDALVVRLNEAKHIHHTIIVLSCYYLNRAPGAAMIELDKYASSMASALLDIQKVDIREYTPLKFGSEEVNAFIRWLLVHKMNKLGKEVFVSFYGSFDKYYDRELGKISELVEVLK